MRVTSLFEWEVVARPRNITSKVNKINKVNKGTKGRSTKNARYSQFHFGKNRGDYYLLFVISLVSPLRQGTPNF